MAQNDAATLVLDTGNFFLAAVDSALPADLAAVTTPWTKVGHTSLEDIFSMESDGGEKSVLGTLQNRSLRTTYSDRTETFKFTLQQFDADSLKLYFGSNMVVNADGTLGVPLVPTATQTAFLAVFVDGTNHFGLYAPKAEILRGDDFDISDTESLAGLPLAVTPLASGSNAWAYAITPLGGA